MKRAIVRQVKESEIRLSSLTVLYITGFNNKYISIVHNFACYIRQFCVLFERTGLSTDKAGLLKDIQNQNVEFDISDTIRDPYILEFTGLEERPKYSESDLETALLDHIQEFLLELGNGFCFEARQKRIGNEFYPANFLPFQ